jgi:hypothetical protein
MGAKKTDMEMMKSLLDEAGLGTETDQLLDHDNDELETPIFSDIVFRGLHLTGNYVFTTVNFTLPTDVLSVLLSLPTWNCLAEQLTH